MIDRTPMVRRARSTASLAEARVVGAVCVLVGAIILAPVGDIRAAGTPAAAFAMVHPAAAVMSLAAGLLLLVAGSLAWLSGMRLRIGVLAILAAVAWFGPEVFAQMRWDPLVRAIGRFWLTAAFWALMLHLGLAVLGRDHLRAWRVALAAAYGLTLITAVGSSATYSAFFDVWCDQTDCSFENPLLVDTGPGTVRWWREAGAVLPAGTGILAVVAATSWLVSSRGRGRARLGVACALLAFGIAAAWRAARVLTVDGENLRDRDWQWSWVALTLAVLAVGVAVSITAIDSWRQTDRMRRIAATLEAAPAPGTLQAVLRAATGDATLRIAYQVADGTLVAPDGTAARPDQSVDIRAISVERAGTALARVEHAVSVEGEVLAAAFTAVVLVALDNERLRAARLAQLAELRASRARIVAVADAERRRMERDLHDGVQQQLLAILFDLRLARVAAERSGTHERAQRLATAEAEAQAAVDEVRRIAHGVHPAILSRSGLSVALASIAEESPLPLEVRADGVGRLPEAVEMAAYQVITEAVAEAPRRGATALTLTASNDGDRLRLGLADDAPVGATMQVRVADRIAAAGGEATLEALDAGGTLLRVELPCA